MIQDYNHPQSQLSEEIQLKNVIKIYTTFPRITNLTRAGKIEDDNLTIF